MAIILLSMYSCAQKPTTDISEEKPLGDNKEMVRDSPANYRIIGTEPFWSCDIIGDTLHYSNAEGVSISQYAIRKIDSDTNFVFQSHNINIDMRTEICSDGMSDRMYAYSAILALDTLVYKGCAYILEK